MACFEEMTGTGMSQAVRAITFGWQTHYGKIAPYEVTQCPFRQGAVRGTKGEKEEATGALRPAILQVACERIADTRLEGKELKVPALGASDVERVLVPVDIVELQAPDFARAEAIDSEQQQDRPVAEVDWLRPCRRLKHTADVIPRRSEWQTGVAVEAWHQDSVRDARLRPPLCFTVAEPCAQPHGHGAE
jgi:hypothetical protein